MGSVRGDRVPPQNIDAERSVLGAIMLPDSSAEVMAKVIGILDEADFYKVAHQKIYFACLNIFERGDPIDLLTLTKELERLGELEHVGGVASIDEMMESVPSTANVEYYARMVKDDSMRRQIIRHAAEVYNMGFDASEDLEELMTKAETGLIQIRQAQHNDDVVPMKQLVKETFVYVQELFHKGEGVIGIPTGFSALDNLTSGLKPGEYIVVAGRPGMGKSTFVQNIAQYASIEMKVPTLIFSPEMSRQSLALRMWASVSQVNLGKLRTGQLSTNDWPKVTIGAGTLSGAPIFIDDTVAIKMGEVQAKCNQAKMMHKIGLVIFDYLQLGEMAKSYTNNVQKYTDISKWLKAIGRNLHVPIVVCSQLSRANTQRTDKRPQLQDLRETGAIEQDADTVIFLHRENYYDKSLHDTTTEVIIEKQRNGETDTIKLGFLPSKMRFTNLSRKKDVQNYSS